ncbi:MAG: NADH-quinone oxidoreductase subunit NuoE [Deltaproteobacteria bacterium]|nr:NADH-quinone oxidoreductase subunit NuoE [Deltaproteobacteria bacterium]
MKIVEFSAENKKRLEEILSHYPTKQAALLPTLWLAQEQFGHISRETMEYVAGLLDVSPAHVYGVVTFYTMFRQKPGGKYHLQVCRTLSCALVGAESLLEHLKKKIGIAENETTPDGRFSLCTVECLASCGTGPAMMVNEKYYENLDPKKIDEILAGLK